LKVLLLRLSRTSKTSTLRDNKRTKTTLRKKRRSQSLTPLRIGTPVKSRIALITRFKASAKVKRAANLRRMLAVARVARAVREVT